MSVYFNNNRGTPIWGDILQIADVWAYDNSNKNHLLVWRNNIYNMHHFRTCVLQLKYVMMNMFACVYNQTRETLSNCNSNPI